MVHRATWRAHGVKLQTAITAEPMPKGWGKHIDSGRHFNVNDDHFQICYESSSGNYFIKHHLTSLFYKIMDTNKKIWSIEGQGKFTKLIGTSLEGEREEFSLYTKVF